MVSIATLVLMSATAAVDAGTVSQGWIRGARSSPSTLLDFTVAVSHSPSSLHELERIYWVVSDPQHENYTHFMSRDQLNRMMVPPPASITSVVEWLRPHCEGGKPSVTISGDFVSCPVTVRSAEQSLIPGAQYFQYSKDGFVVHRTEAGSYDTPLRDHVDFVSPTHRFPPRMRTRVQHESHATHTKGGPTRLGTEPSSIKTLYKIPDTPATGNPLNQQHVAAFLSKFMSPNDLDLFYGYYYPAGKDLPNGKPKIVGPNDQSQPTAEGSLDIQYIMSIAPNVSTTYWYVNGTRPYATGVNEDFLQWLLGLATSTDTLPSVISVSYADEEFVVDEDYQQRVDVEFQKLGVQGAALFFGSGDNGVTGDKGVCLPGNKFVPWWPASSPFVTAVGGTEAFNPLLGASFSGGGFSNRYSRPAYQDKAVATYLAASTGMPPSSCYNQTGAAFPDVSAVALGFWTYVGGIPDEVGGTSAATPTFAGIVSLLNDARMAQGKKALGPMNQLIYQHPEAFTDITRGVNTGGGGCEGCGGFSAAKGWDPVTGMGSPRFDVLMKLALSLP